MSDAVVSQDPQQACEKLVVEAIENKHTEDNVCVIIMYLAVTLCLALQSPKCHFHYVYMPAEHHLICQQSIISYASRALFLICKQRIISRMQAAHYFSYAISLEA